MKLFLLAENKNKSESANRFRWETLSINGVLGKETMYPGEHNLWRDEWEKNTRYEWISRKSDACETVISVRPQRQTRGWEKDENSLGIALSLDKIQKQRGIPHCSHTLKKEEVDLIQRWSLRIMGRVKRIVWLPPESALGGLLLNTTHTLVYRGH